uniref:Thioredoxin domain-containing protein n=1 Tax=Oncorhynchus kisutch TaxID=8019 RepID=A0A8C7J390_ONCKI
MIILSVKTCSGLDDLNLLSSVCCYWSARVFIATMPGLLLGDVFPNFEAETTNGKIKFHDFLGDSWGILFSHPCDYTPVCTTELGRAAKLSDEFSRRNVKMIALSIDSLEDHRGWTKDILAYNNEESGCAFPFPIIADHQRELAVALGMLDPDEKDKDGMPLTARCVSVKTCMHTQVHRYRQTKNTLRATLSSCQYLSTVSAFFLSVSLYRFCFLPVSISLPFLLSSCQYLSLPFLLSSCQYLSLPFLLSSCQYLSTVSAFFLSVSLYRFCFLPVSISLYRFCFLPVSISLYRFCFLPVSISLYRFCFLPVSISLYRFCFLPVSISLYRFCFLPVSISLYRFCFLPVSISLYRFCFLPVSISLYRFCFLPVSISLPFLLSSCQYLSLPFLLSSCQYLSTVSVSGKSLPTMRSSSSFWCSIFHKHDLFMLLQAAYLHWLV